MRQIHPIPQGGNHPLSFDPARCIPLPESFFARDARSVARSLLGKVLICGRGRKLRAGRVVEVEAYLGESDPAAHAASGCTPRNAVLFGPPGRAYVYFIYGRYFCLNVACQPTGKAGCVLFRALEPVAGVAAMSRSRGIVFNGDADVDSSRRERTLRNLTSGPSRLCDALEITRAKHNSLELFNRESGLWIGDDGYPTARIATTPRIGITNPAARDWPLRYVLAGNRFVSGTRQQRV